MRQNMRICPGVPRICRRDENLCGGRVGARRLRVQRDYHENWCSLPTPRTSITVIVCGDRGATFLFAPGAFFCYIFAHKLKLNKKTFANLSCERSSAVFESIYTEFQADDEWKQHISITSRIFIFKAYLVKYYIIIFHCGDLFFINLLFLLM